MRPINRCFDRQMLNLCHQAMYLEKLTTVVRRYLPETLASVVSVGKFNKGCLALVITDQIWATELRYCLPSLRDELRSRERLHQLTNITIIVNLKN